MPQPMFLGESGCKGTAFFLNHQNFSKKIFSFHAIIFQVLINIKSKNVYTLLYNIRKRDISIIYSRSKPTRNNLTECLTVYEVRVTY